MREVSVVRTDSGVPVASRVGVADSFRGRLRGLLGRRPLTVDEGLLLLDCNSVHTVGMRYAIDIAFLDDDGVVVRTIGNLRPWSLGVGGAGAVHTLELRSGRLSETGTAPGVRLSWR